MVRKHLVATQLGLVACLAILSGCASWKVKASEGPTGPGDCHFLGSNVNETPNGFQLQIGPNQTCAEVLRPLPLGPVEVSATLIADFDDLPENVVIGFFVYRNDTSEFDFEAARWGEEQATNAQFVVAPVRDDSLHRIRLRNGRVRVQMRWWPGRIEFNARQGDRVHRWTFNGDVPNPFKQHHLHVNLWIMSGTESPTRPIMNVEHVAVRPMPL